MAAKKEALSNSLLDAALRAVAYTSPTAVFAALFTVAPTATTQGTEVDDELTGYTRMAVTFAAADEGEVSNSADVIWAAATGGGYGEVVAVAICASDVPGTDDQLYYGVLDSPTTIADDDEASFVVGALVVTES